MDQQILRSVEDRSINFVTPTEDGGAIEARFVQRLGDTIIVYLSSASGCDKACRFCHLTQQRQTMTQYVTVHEYLNQAKDVLEFVRAEGKLAGVKFVNFNFMARGDALANPHFVGNTHFIVRALDALAVALGLQARFKISTIFPKGLLDQHPDQLLGWVNHCAGLHPELKFYYSLYTLDNRFRKRWIPKAMSSDKVGEAFSDTDQLLVVHHALIENENTSVDDIYSIHRWLRYHRIKTWVNIVRYNPFDDSCGKELPEAMIESYKSVMETSPQVNSVQIVTKVGFDVKASCGMFVK